MLELTAVEKEYGEELTSFVAATKMVEIALRILDARGGNGMEVNIIGDSWNLVAAALVGKTGWTDRQFEDCAHAILLAATMEEKKVLAPPEH